MRRLRSPEGAIPRGMLDHRTNDGRRYTAYCRTVLATYGVLPAIAQTTLREAGRAAVELERLGLALERARARKRRSEVARLRRASFALREQLARLERRLAELAATQRPANPIDDVHRAVEAANR